MSTSIQAVKTVVVFRRFKKGGDLIALFPAEINYSEGHCESYQHVGQHGSADYAHCISRSIPVSAAEYAPLKRELESIGYDLTIRQKYRRQE